MIENISNMASQQGVFEPSGQGFVEHKAEPMPPLLLIERKLYYHFLSIDNRGGLGRLYALLSIAVMAQKHLPLIFFLPKLIFKVFLLVAL